MPALGGARCVVAQGARLEGVPLCTRISTPPPAVQLGYCFRCLLPILFTRVKHGHVTGEAPAWDGDGELTADAFRHSENALFLPSIWFVSKLIYILVSYGLRWEQEVTIGAFSSVRLNEDSVVALISWNMGCQSLEGDQVQVGKVLLSLVHMCIV